MKKISFFILFSFFLISILHAQQWNAVSSSTEKAASITLLSSDVETSVIKVCIPGFYLRNVNENKKISKIIEIPNSARMLKATCPDLVSIASSIIIPDDGKMSYEIVSSSYVDYPGINMAPSKGNLFRNINPEDVPYQRGKVYSKNRFFPGNLVSLRDPYILRDYRGQSVVFYPFQYNPITKVLRVYKDFTVKIKKVAKAGINVFNRTKALTSVDEDFKQIYQRKFLNYGSGAKYLPLSDLPGRLLIICYATYMNDMQSFVEWKRQKGIQTDIVSAATIGTGSAADILAYVTNYYNTNGLTYLILVGDGAQIAPLTKSGDSDAAYGHIVGTDSYAEVFVGRFSAETSAQLLTQVNRTIYYEKLMDSTNVWLKNAAGLASNEGGGTQGDQLESDQTHIENIRTSLLGYTYSNVAQLYQANNVTIADVSAAVNNGVSVINYTGHGAITAWGTTGYSNTDVTALTNQNKLPYIFDVACVNGDFRTNTCFAEAWLRATYNNNPTGALAIIASTINQSWNSPMEAMDEMDSILVESYNDNIRRTFGGVTINGCMKMNDSYGTDGYDMTNTWTIFGDPSVMLRTDRPAKMQITHQNTAYVGATQFAVNCNINGALVAISRNTGVSTEILGRAYVSGGVANITFTNPLANPGTTMLITATAYNKVTYTATVNVINNNIPNEATVESIVVPENSYNCVGIPVQPKVIIRNLGNNNITSLHVNYKLNNGAVVSQTWTGNLATSGTVSIYFPVTTFVNGNHQFTAFTSLPNNTVDGYPSNDTLSKSFSASSAPITSSFTANQTAFCTAPASVIFTNNSQNANSYLWEFGDGTTSIADNPQHIYTTPGFYSVSLTADAGVCGAFTFDVADYIQIGAPAPVVTSASHCGADSLTLFASAQGQIYWYDAPTGGNLIDSGTTYTTPMLSATATYYVETGVYPASQNVGELNATTNGAMFTSSAQHYLVFDCFAPMTLKSVLVNASTAGNRVISLMNSAGTVIQSVTVNIPIGVSRVTLNMNIPVGTDLRLAGPLTPNLYRTNSTALTYPYTIANYISIKGSSASTSPTSYYYFFYDWEVQPQACLSARVPVNAIINTAPPVAQFSYTANATLVHFINQSIDGVNYWWSFGNGITCISTNPQIMDYVNGGIYQVTLIAMNPCGNDTIIKSIEVSGVGVQEITSGENINVYPNPAENYFIIDLSSIATEVNSVAVSNMLGQQIYYKNGINETKIQINDLPKGMYLVEVTTHSRKLLKKVVVK